MSLSGAEVQIDQDDEGDCGRERQKDEDDPESECLCE